MILPAGCAASPPRPLKIRYASFKNSVLYSELTEKIVLIEKDAADGIPKAIANLPGLP